MKHLSRIILTLWIFIGLVAGNTFAIGQAYQLKNANSQDIHNQKAADSKVLKTDECRQTHTEAFIECENELEDDNDKLFLEAESLNFNYFEPVSLVAQSFPIECQTHSHKLHILYCVFRI